MNNMNEKMNALLRRQSPSGPGVLADPADADVYLDPAAWTGPAGAVDETAKAAAIDDLLAARPYLAAGARVVPPPVPSVPAGARSGPDDARAPNMNDVLRGTRRQHRRDLAEEVEYARALRLSNPPPDTAA